MSPKEESFKIKEIKKDLQKASADLGKVSDSRHVHLRIMEKGKSLQKLPSDYVSNTILLVETKQTLSKIIRKLDSLDIEDDF